MNWERIFVLLRKELKQALREPRMRVMLVMPPLLQLIIFGFAVNLDVDHASIAWMDQDRSPQSRELLAAFTGSGRFEVVRTPASEREASLVLDRGEAQAVVRVLPGFGRDLLRARPTEVQVLVDGTNSNTAQLIGSQTRAIVQRYASGVLADWQRQKLVGATADGPVRLAVPRLASEPRVWFNPELRSRNYFVPGVLVNIIALITIMLTSMAIVREKEIGTMEQLMVSPVRPLELVLGKTLPFALVGIFDLFLVTAAALIIFKVPFRGSAAFLLASACLFILSTLGFGLFISTVSRTQQQAMMSTFFFFQPAFMLSGFAFPIRNMPEAVQWLTLINPNRYFLEIVRGVFLKGAGFDVHWPQFATLAVFGVVILTLSAARFRKRLD